jgi:hypothetical protein
VDIKDGNDEDQAKRKKVDDKKFIIDADSSDPAHTQLLAYHPGAWAHDALVH